MWFCHFLIHWFSCGRSFKYLRFQEKLLCSCLSLVKREPLSCSKNVPSKSFLTLVFAYKCSNHKTTNANFSSRFFLYRIKKNSASTVGLFMCCFPQQSVNLLFCTYLRQRKVQLFPLLLRVARKTINHFYLIYLKTLHLFWVYYLWFNVSNIKWPPLKSIQTWAWCLILAVFINFLPTLKEVCKHNPPIPN